MDKVSMFSLVIWVALGVKNPGKSGIENLSANGLKGVKFTKFLILTYISNDK